MRTRSIVTGILLLFFVIGCHSTQLEKTAKPVVEPIKNTTNAVFQERTIGNDNTPAQAVIFPREEEQEHKQFKLKF